MESTMTWRRCSSTCTAAPMQIVSMKATMRTGTARRSTGSAVSRRRYAGVAIDCASPLIECERKDALANSARAMPASVSDDPLDPVRRYVPHRPRISPFESTRIDLSRVGSQYFFNFCPTLSSTVDKAKKSCAQSHLRGDAAISTQRLLLLQDVFFKTWIRYRP